MRFVFLHLPVIGDESVRAAEATECAGEQDLFWEYHDSLFDNWDGENQGAFADVNLLRFASDLGMNRSMFQECLDSRRYLERIGTHRQLALSINVSSTPTVIIDNQLMVGLREFEEYKEQIELAILRQSG